MMYRLDPHPEEWIDRSAPLAFSFEDRAYEGFAGDTLSSALCAAGVPYLARSFKYHRPRGVLSCANHDSNTLFQVDGTPNVRGDVTELRAGMRISAINTFGGLFADKARHLDRVSRWLPVGFYYKAFHTKRLLPRWERMFRRLTGLGSVSLAAPREITAKRYGFCDVLVIGGGPSGLSAALAAAAAGARVALVDETPHLGASVGLTDSSRQTLRQLTDAVTGNSSIRRYQSTVAAGYYADHWVALVDAQRLTKMRAKAVVFATGVIETPAVFRNNDVPGVMLASGALRLVSRYRVAPGRKVVMVAANREAYEACSELQAQGVAVTTILDMRESLGGDEVLMQECAARGAEVILGHAPYSALRDQRGALCGLEYVAVDAHGARNSAAMRRIQCDAVLMSVGWVGSAQLFLQSGGTLSFSEELQQFLPADLPAGVLVAGRLNGVYDFDARVADGRCAGSAAATQAGFENPAVPRVTRSERTPSHAFPIIDHPEGKNFVDFDEDIQVKDLEAAIQEGFDSSELLKRYSTVGMGPSQGKHSNLNALRVLARARNLGLRDLAMTTSRPPYHPVPLKILAGRGFHPLRRTPIDALHSAAGAVWMPAGNWRRPEYYQRTGESRQAGIDAEVWAVRNAVGLIDVGTLGKIEIYGAQAGEFLDRVYAGKYSDLRIGMTRYGLMLDESGVIIDDGVIARLAPDHYYFTTTTGGSATVFRELLRLNALWGMDCALVNLTGHLAAFNFAGPLSREILQPLTNLELDDGAFPFLAARVGEVAGIPARLFRVGFVGELGYEIHVAAGVALSLWQTLVAAGIPRGLRPFGVEAQRVLRLEKGHFIVGQDTDGLTDPLEANALWAVNMRKPFFVGQRSLRILEQRGPRQRLVGIELIGPATTLKECHLIIDEGAIAGRVTSVARSQALNKSIGLALIAPHLAGSTSDIRIRDDHGTLLTARIAPIPFYDPKNQRQKFEVGL
jgi:sarcosine oxidase subunit alpha